MDMTFTFSQLLNEIVSLWQKQEEQKKLREAEKDQLYRFKVKVHGDERSQDQIEEDEFRSSFPSYIKEFLDIADMPSLEQSHSMEEDTEESDESKEVVHDFITDEDIIDVYTCHNALFTNLTNCDWLKATTGTEIKSHDFTMPVLSCHSVGATIALQCRDALEPDLDADIIGGHILACYIMEQQNSPLNDDMQKSSYDIYLDPNIAEIMQCQPVLENVTKRVRELQMEWPDHPTLKQILLIVDRILSFPVTSPVIKYLTGLELLVQKAQDWESNASRHVSLITELGELSTLIVKWRKMELGCWNECLDSVVKKYTQKSYRWWFYLYQLILSYVSEDMESKATDPEADSERQDKDFIQSFKQFIEKSTLGEYQTRLDMLKAFHCQLVHMDKSPKQEYLLTILWNLHQFYSQFIDRINDEIKQQRAPIEKELKNFVKIARWTDMNYWALKQTTEKTHRTLHKHVKEFEGVLRLPVSGCLEEKDKSIGGTEESNRTNWIEQFQDQITALLSSRYNECYSDVSDPSTFVAADALQNNLPRLCNKLNKHWSGVVQQTGYSKLIISLDEFTGEIIETVHELQQLEVSQHEDKEKQKSEAKHIGQKKRKALADLFKYLTTLGLSHRKGLILLNKEEGDTSLLVPAFDLMVLLHGSTPGSRLSNMTDIWTSCQHYYFRCITRKAKFFSALQASSKELGVGDLERLKGFTEQLSHIIIGQYSHIADTSVHYKKLRELIGMVSNLKSVSEEKSYQLPQKPIADWINKLKTMLVSMIEGFSQFEVLLNCCPKKAGEATPYPSPFPVTELPQIALAKHGDEMWNKAMEIIKVLITKTKDLQSKVKSLTSHHIWTMFDFEILESVITEVKYMDSDILFVEKLFNDPDGSGSALNRSLYFLRELIHSNIVNFTNWKFSLFEKRKMLSSANYELNQNKLTEFSNLIEDMIKNILMDIQKLVKLHDKDATKSSDGQDVADTEDEDILEGHLVKLMNDGLKEDVTSLSVLKISDMLKNLTNQITGLWEEDHGKSVQTSTRCIEMLQRCLPLLKKYSDIVEFYLANQLAVNRTSGKLLSVLFAVFTELATKGFCMPAEYSDEMAGEGATEFADIEGGGIGEGEGVKDVSDQIETEDQLHEAKKPGEKEEESKDQPDVPSEDNAIEMSDDFDGKLQDLEPTEAGDESDDDNDDEDDDKLDKQMGEVDDDNENKLDEEMWGGDDNEDDSQTKEDKKEDTGPGADQDGKSELAAKDDIPEGPDKDQKGDKQQEEEKMEDDDNNENQKPNELQIDESEYDEEKIDPQQRNQEQEPPSETMDLPEELNLDEAEGEEEQQNTGDDMESEMEKIDTENQEKQEDEELVDDIDKNLEENADDAEQQTEDNKELKEENINNEEEQEDESKEDKNKDLGFSAQDEDVDKSLQEEGEDKDSNEKPQEAEHHGKTSHAAENVEQSDTAQDQAGQSENEQKESEGVGTSSSEQLEGHQGQSSSKISQGTAEDKQQKLKRKPGHSDVDRSIGSTEQQCKKLKTTDKPAQDDGGEEDQNNTSEKMDADLYQHIKDSQSHDAQTLDVATAEQQQIQAVPNKETEEDADSVNDDDDVEMIDKEEQEDEEKTSKLSAQLNKNKDLKKDGQGESTEENVDEETMEVEIEGEKVLTNIVPRGTESTIHTELQYLHLENQESGEVDVEQMRKELEEWLNVETHTQQSPEVEAEAGEIWHKYEALTSALSQELCEQLRLVLEPSQATKLKGDYRTGKRLNMRKVIPYIASQFRKDKIWLRRTKPSKRNYQIMLAIDDSSSMVDNHSKQMAYESLALISNALTLLEAGELAICSFGETVKLLHPFTEQFTNQSGAKILQHLKFEQKKTKIALLLKQATGFMVDARSRQHGMMGNPETSQLMLIVSDGRGLFMEGMETVKSAVRQARELNIFLVFVIIDNPQNKDSILDIRVPVFKSAGQMPEIKSYMDSFPFPFYIILRDINSLPNVLCDALRQWFELVTSVDR